MIYKYFLPFYRLPFSCPLVDGFLCCMEIFSLVLSHLFLLAVLQRLSLNTWLSRSPVHAGNLMIYALSRESAACLETPER